MKDALVPRIAALIITGLVCLGAPSPSSAAWTETQYTRDPGFYDTSDYVLSSPVPFQDAEGWDGQAVTAIVKAHAHPNWRVKFDVTIYQVELPDGKTQITAPLPLDGQDVLAAIAADGPAQLVKSFHAAARSSYPISMVHGNYSVGFVPFIEDAQVLYAGFTYTNAQAKAPEAHDLAYRLKLQADHPFYIQTHDGRTATLIEILPTLAF